MVYLYINGIGFRDRRSKLKFRIMGGVGGAFMCGLPETKPVVRQKTMLNGLISRVTVQGVVTEEDYFEIKPLLRNVLMTEWLMGGPAVSAPSIARKPQAALKEPAVDAEVLEITNVHRAPRRTRKRMFAEARLK